MTSARERIAIERAARNKRNYDEHIRNMDRCSAVIDIMLNGETEQPRDVRYVLVAYVVEPDGTPAKLMTYTNASRNEAELVVMKVGEQIAKEKAEHERTQTS